jgi:RNA polymerase sigma factor (TIGR02999 family)
VISATQYTTRLVRDLAGGNERAADQLLPLVYAELRRLARSYLRQYAPGHTLQPTALVHEAYLRLVAQKGEHYTCRAHFMAVAARAMRQILIDHARRRGAVKRGGCVTHVSLNEQLIPAQSHDVDVLKLEEMLKRLTKLDARKGRVVELRFYGGLTIEDTATVLGIARSTATEDWRVARAWLASELHEGATT